MVPVPLVTSRYRAVHDFAKTREPRGFLPVKTSVGSPRFIAEAKAWPKAEFLAPYGLIKIEDRDEFETRYRERLDGHGVPAIAAALHAIYVGQPAPRLPLALLCFEDLDAGDWCHRRTFATWWTNRTGLVIEDFNTAEGLAHLSLNKRKPAAAGHTAAEVEDDDPRRREREGALDVDGPRERGDYLRPLRAPHARRRG
jgi:hypothetical protein